MPRRSSTRPIAGCGHTPVNLAAWSKRVVPPKGRSISPHTVRERIVAFGFGLILVLIFDQGVQRFLPREPIDADRPRYLQTVQYHPILGWSGYPNFAETNDGIRYHTNSVGYRDREPVEVKDGQKLRVLFLGDSFTWGDEVSAEDRFTDLLEHSCGSHCDPLPPIRAINRGII